MSVGPDFLYELKGIPKPGAVKKIGSSTKKWQKKKFGGKRFNNF